MSLRIQLSKYDLNVLFIVVTRLKERRTFFAKQKFKRKGSSIQVLGGFVMTRLEKRKGRGKKCVQKNQAEGELHPGSIGQQGGCGRLCRDKLERRK